MCYVNVEHQMYRDFDTINLVYVYIQVCMSKLSLFIIERFTALLTLLWSGSFCIAYTSYVERTLDIGIFE